ncbi:MAG: D-alanyl-D-alanine carboxypeptidase [Bacilli bacterium]|nr:D-alanyl-D-alanine carboxypeptidase [Bacilli bacterium]
MKKIITLIIMIVMGLCLPYLYSVKISAEPNLANNSKSATMVNVETGDVIFEKNANEKLAPASMTKIMSIILFMEALVSGQLKADQLVTTSLNASQMGGSQIFLSVGEQMKVSELLKSVVIASANDACVALAEEISGSIESFVKLMNDKAKMLGLENTNFANATGLPIENHYTTSNDMAIMSAYLIKNYPEIIKLSSTYEDYVRKDTDNPFWLVNTNRLVKHYPSIDGLKTGWTNDAGYCLSATSYNDDNKMRLVAVVMGCETPQKRSADVVELLNYGHSNYHNQLVLNKGSVISTTNNIKLLPEDVRLLVSNDFYVCKKKQDKEKNYIFKLELNNEDNNKVGMVIIYDGDVEIGRVDVNYELEPREVNYWLLLFRIMKRLFN